MHTHAFWMRPVALAAGVVFGIGLGVSGMIDPAKVLNFLDLAGHWDPTLLLVMGGAIVVALPAFQLALRGAYRPLCSARFDLPARTVIDWRLVGGAAVFGIGWGLGGLCPGPAVAALASAQWPVVGFVVAMLLGQWVASRIPAAGTHHVSSAAAKMRRGQQREAPHAAPSRAAAH